jgi:hypothetical protein
VFGISLGSFGACEASYQAPTAGYSAGTISVTGTNTALSLSPNGLAPSAYYTATPTPTYPLFDPATTIALSAPGTTDFGAFSATATGPAPVLGVTPPTSVSRSGYTATWTAGSGPGFWVELVGFVGTSSANTLRCRVSDTGSFTVPPEAFALMPSADDHVGVLLTRVDERTSSSPNLTVAIESYFASAPVPLTP